ncbi:MAG: tRNA (adenosine(37)-N6)-dimethylallyltransferase MiaA [Lachnospiraceae bacterium]|nr:tRNA (adenosine(37)-N6)-dimethylallyltransferase MiaA [Lachnospiraceae bacterium]
MEETNTKHRLPLLILTGPTAVGKTNLSVRLAQAVNGEIISADSMQVYRRMDIGTAKIKKEEMCGVPHHLIDICEPQENYNVVRFAMEAKRLIKEIADRGHIPILVGGTGFYIQAVLYDIDFTKTEEDTAYRKELAEYADKYGAQALHALLAKADPASAAAIHANNVKRVIRALEFYKQTGGLISVHNEEQHQKESAYNSAYFVLTQERAVLYRRIEQRIDQMLEEGLVEEVRALIEEGCTADMVSMQGLGYKEILSYLNGECSLQEAVSVLKRDTRHFAKRQITWFRRERDVLWFDRGDYANEQEILAAMLREAEKTGMLT